MNHCMLPKKTILLDQIWTEKKKRKKEENDYGTMTSDMNPGRGGLSQKYQWFFSV